MKIFDLAICLGLDGYIGESLYEAAALGLNLLRKEGWVDHVGSATRLQIEVQNPVVVHTVTAG